MGNRIGVCFTGADGEARQAHHHHNPEEGLGHSFCYVRSDPTRTPSSVISTNIHSEDSVAAAAASTSPAFKTISGASVSANTSTFSTSGRPDLGPTAIASGPLFESSASFAAVTLQPVPRSGPLHLEQERGFPSGPIARGFLSGPIEPTDPAFSVPLNRSFSHSQYGRFRPRKRSGSLIHGLRRAMFGKNSVVAPIKGQDNGAAFGPEIKTNSEMGPLQNPKLQWAQGKAGEDRVHVVVSEEHGWVFVGIYDGFNGPDATDFLLSNLYSSVQKELLKDSDPNVGSKAIDHGEVLKAMDRGLRKTEETYLDIADKMLDENPELCLMGSCVLAMLMKGEDVYVMNVGDSRAVLAQNEEVDLRFGKIDQELERINEELFYDSQVSDGVKSSLGALQLTLDHSTCIREEVTRIEDEHPDDPLAIVNDRVKGSLKVTRAFGAGFLKQPKWNNAILEMFRIEYVGDSPYINCQPFLCHHRLGPKDQFLILTSDGLYQYFTNDEAVAEVERFIASSPEGDPAQHLVQEVLFRAAKKAGMDFHELLEIPQGDRRKYHDDVSIIIISFEGRIWRSCV